MVTITHIAEKVGVSRATVSLILNGRDAPLRISQSTRQKVLEAAQEHGFRRNELLRSAVSGKNRMIGFLVRSPRMESAARILDGALEAAEVPGYTVKVMRLKGNQLDQEVIDRCIELRLAAVIALYLAPPALERLHEELAPYRIPLAVLDTHEKLGWGVCLEADDAQAMRLAVQHLRNLGHEQIAFVSGVPSDVMSRGRERAFQNALKKSGVAPGRVVWGHLDNAQTVQTVRELMEMEAPERPTALVGITDGVAMSALRGVRLAGLEVPRDVSVVGYGGMSLAEFADPPLTTVVQPFEQIGAHAIERLLERVHAPEGAFNDTPLRRLLPAHLTVRESTAPLPR